MVSYIVSVINPSINLLTGTFIRKGRKKLGDYDFVVEWQQAPNTEQVKGLIRQIDQALLYTGCRYTITTKEKLE